MRTAQDLKQRWLTQIPEVMLSTGMWASTGREMDSACYSLLQDLCFLDERDADAKIAWSELPDRYGKLGVCGPFRTMFKLERCQAEVASVYAEVRTYQPGEGTYAMAWDDDPLIRSLRRAAGEFEAGLILTLYGKVKRWGTGWWIDHPSADSTEESLAIAQQLKMIREADPSQAGRQQQPECEDVGPCGRWASHGAK